MYNKGFIANSVLMKNLMKMLELYKIAVHLMRHALRYNSYVTLSITLFIEHASLLTWRCIQQFHTQNT